MPAILPPLPPPQLFAAAKYAVYALLAGNVAALLWRRGWSDALDALGWLLLLAVMEYETRRPHAQLRHWPGTYLALVLRLVGYGIVLHAWQLYQKQQHWLDLANTSLWLLVCAALEYDVYVAARLSQRDRALRHAVKLTLYALLIGCAGLWGLRGDWLLFYDALLWLFAFFAIELNVFGLAHPPPQQPAQQPPR